MRTPGQVLPVHEIRGKDSCISWVVEFILKLHDENVALGEWPVQTAHPLGIGFGDEAKALLDAHNITAWDESYEWDDFENHSKADAQLGFPLVFSLPTATNLNFQTCECVGFTYHGCIAIHNPTIAYVTRQHGNPNLLPISLPRFYTVLRTRIKPDYQFHCLRHRPRQPNGP